MNNVIEIDFSHMDAKIELTRQNIILYGVEVTEYDYIETQKLHSGLAKWLIKKAIQKFSKQRT